MENNFCIVVHGGVCEKIHPEDNIDADKYKKSVCKIIETCFEHLKNGSTALDTVQKAIEMLENDPLYNAGTGCCLTSEGTIELDAMLMNGKDRAYGAVAGVNFCKNPINLARLVMDKSKHCFIVGEGLRKFAKSVDYCVEDDPKSIITENAIRDWNRYTESTLKKKNKQSAHKCGDTVGAIAMDIYGNLACGTSTGGICGKLPGRVGDVPVVGCGGFANTHGSASCTGHGESIMKYTLCRDIVEAISHNESPLDVSKRLITEIHQKTNACIGLICINHQGDIGVYHNGEFMPWASMSRKSGLSCFM